MSSYQRCNIDNNIREVPGGFVNLTTKRIPAGMRTILSFGPKFKQNAITDIDQHKTHQIENITKWMDYLSLNEIKSTRGAKANSAEWEREILMEYLQTQKRMSTVHKREITKDKMYRTIDNMYKETLKYMDDNPDLIITNADKGNVTIAITRDEYYRKMNKLIREGIEAKVYEIIAIDPTEKITKIYEEQIKPIIAKINNIESSERSELNNTRWNVPRMYGAVKIHKPDKKMRPVVSTIGAIGRPLSEWITKMLNEIPAGANNVKNSEEVHDIIKHTRRQEGYEYMSIDLSDMFTNIDMDKVIKDIGRVYGEYIRERSGIEFKDFSNLTEFVTRQAAVFTTKYLKRNTYLKQKKGIAMGSPVAQIIARIYVDNRIRHNLEQLDKYRIDTLINYVDDFLIHANREDITEITKDLEEAIGIPVTIEREKNRTINFLQVTIIRNKERTETKFFTKKIASMRMLNKYSRHPDYMKFNTNLRYCQTAIRITDTRYVIRTASYLYIKLWSNGYGKTYIKRILIRVIKYEHKKKAIEPTTTNNICKVIHNMSITNLPELGIKHPYRHHFRKVNTKGTARMKDVEETQTYYRQFSRLGCIDKSTHKTYLEAKKNKEAKPTVVFRHVTESDTATINKLAKKYKIKGHRFTVRDEHIKMYSKLTTKAKHKKLINKIDNARKERAERAMGIFNRIKKRTNRNRHGNLAYRHEIVDNRIKSIIDATFKRIKSNDKTTT